MLCWTGWTVQQSAQFNRRLFLHQTLYTYPSSGTTGQPKGVSALAMQMCEAPFIIKAKS